MGRKVVIGVGNEYRRDDGVGPIVVNLLRSNHITGIELTTSLGDTAELIDLWTGAELAIVVDAVVTDAHRIGKVHQLSLDSRNQPAGAVSSHGLQLGEAVELARALGRLPDRLEFYAIEIADADYGAGLSPAVRRSAMRVAERIIAEVNP